MGESFVVADDGTQLYMRVHDGPSRRSGAPDAVTALLCDGIACDGFIWKYLWDALAERARVAHFHYRGHGRSKRPADPTHIGIDAHAGDVDSVRRALGDPDVVLFGHSMGCQVVLENYRLHPERVRGLVLVCGAPGHVTHSFKGSDRLAQVLPRLIEAVDKHPQIARAIWGSVPPGAALKVALALGEIDAKLMAPPDLLPYLEHMVDMDLPMFLRMLRAAGEHTAQDLLPSVRVPVLVLAGDKDTFTPPHLAEEMAAAIPGGELLMTSGTHVVPLEQRALVQERVGAFLDKIEQTGAERARTITPA